MQSIHQILASINISTLSQFFSQNAIQKAKHYLNKVEHISASGLSLTAKVRGSDHITYVTTILFSSVSTNSFSSPFRSVRCTCPVGHFCKHAIALIFAAKQSPIPEAPREEVLHWASDLKKLLILSESTEKKKKASPYSILYGLQLSIQRNKSPRLLILKGQLDKQGRVKGEPDHWYNYDKAIMKPPAFVSEDDLPIFRIIYQSGQSHYGTYLFGQEGKTLLDMIIATKRCFLLDGSETTIPAGCSSLRAGPARNAKIIWHDTESGTTPRPVIEPPVTDILDIHPLCYLDKRVHEIGPIDFGQGPIAQQVFEALLRLPALSALELPIVASALESIAPALPCPIPVNIEPLPLLDKPLIPVLSLYTIHAHRINPHRGYTKSYFMENYDYALIYFGYGGVKLPFNSESHIVKQASGQYAKIKRDEQAEIEAIKTLKNLGFLPVHPSVILAISPEQRLPNGAWGLESEASWACFSSDIAPILKARGWKIEYQPDFRHHILTVESWQTELQEKEAGWFDLSLGTDIDGQRIELGPLLSTLFKVDARWLDKTSLAAIKNDEYIELKTAEGQRIRTKAARIKPLASTLIDLFDGVSATSPTLKVSGFDAFRLYSALESCEERTRLPLEHWINKIEGMKTASPVPEPAGFKINLRSYQQEGLAWLQHLRKHDLGGILADDMGLGKTAQTLAHLMTEKQSGRLNKPSLVVLPTSLVFNWQREAERFAPALKVLKLQGSNRHAIFEQILDYDICLTTYPLLARDTDKLTAYEYYYLILDEAQTVKNAASLAAKAVRQIKAKHKLCITGTPLENHLGELWSQFDFLMPGFLGTSKDFTRYWRTPIEKQGHTLRRELLAQRVAPFILRRKKEEVAKELPSKTIIIRTIELEGAQRDLYEVVRAAMDQRIRDEIAKRGFNHSQIVILDALLKLRQVCCDPRLLKTAAATKVKERAKLNQLMQMLPELVIEGRKILVFSQFSSMLGLIELELKKEKITYSLLTGDTVDRETAIRDFQEGACPIFLISLKAGGVGLNLTAADTVIHFDPWWNPAVENQATDRAHRLGQTKNVFVYKLIVSGSIEEKIMVLQEKKAQLAASILSEDHEGGVKFSEDDIRNLLAPLPDKL